MYMQGFIVPVPADKQDAYKDVAEKFWPIAHDNGAIEHVEAWEADVADGKQTDFRKAVALEDGEKVVFSWVVWPDKATAEASNEKLMSDPRMEEMGKDMPFDGMRMIMGGFDAIVEEGSPGGSYTDGFIVPVPEAKRDAYRQLASKMAKVFRQHGASRVVESIADDVNRGKVTDFYRAVKAEDGETIAFSFIEWPDKATRDEAWQKIMNDESLKPEGDMPFSGQRMFWGGFDKFIDTSEPAPIAQGAAPISA